MSGKGTWARKAKVFRVLSLWWQEVQEGRSGIGRQGRCRLWKSIVWHHRQGAI